jgi:Fanconi anemia group M protein
MLENIMILVDDRERVSGICEELDMLDVAYAICRLDIGDYIVNSCVTVERKTIQDFLLSIKDNRMFTQAAKLRKNGRRSVLILEGQRLPGSRGIKGMLCSLSVQWYLPILRSNDISGTAWLLKRMHEYNKIKERPVLHYDNRVKRPQLSCAEKMLLQIEGIGADKARALINHFGSIRNVFSAEMKELRRVPGIGKGLAGRIISLMEREQARQ